MARGVLFPLGVAVAASGAAHGGRRVGAAAGLRAAPAPRRQRPGPIKLTMRRRQQRGRRRWPLRRTNGRGCRADLNPATQSGSELLGGVLSPLRYNAFAILNEVSAELGFSNAAPRLRSPSPLLWVPCDCHHPHLTSVCDGLRIYATRDRFDFRVAEAGEGDAEPERERARERPVDAGEDSSAAAASRAAPRLRFGGGGGAAESDAASLSSPNGTRLPLAAWWVKGHSRWTWRDEEG